MNYLDYWCDEMRERSVERTVVPVRYDPFDVTIGYARIGGRWHKCVCGANDLVGCSERELQLVASELRKRNRLVSGRERVEITQKQLADFRRENAAQEIILRQQRHDRETRAALSVFEGGQSGRDQAHVAPSSMRPLPSQASQAKGRQPEPEPSLAPHRASDGDKLRVLRRIR